MPKEPDGCSTDAQSKGVYNLEGILGYCNKNEQFVKSTLKCRLDFRIQETNELKVGQMKIRKVKQF